jgi:hypothetical protein
MNWVARKKLQQGCKRLLYTQYWRWDIKKIVVAATLFRGQPDLGMAPDFQHFSRVSLRSASATTAV